MEVREREDPLWRIYPSNKYYIHKKVSANFVSMLKMNNNIKGLEDDEMH